jgi:hypothetical protein
MKRWLPLIVIFFFAISCAVAQKKTPATKPDQSNPNGQSGKSELEQVMHYLKEARKADSLGASSRLSGDEVLLEYTKVLKSDAEAHRVYIQEYYDRILYTIGGILTITSAVLAFFGIKTFRDAKKHLKEIFDNTNKKRLEDLWLEKSKEMSDRMDALTKKMNEQVTSLTEELRINHNINTAQSQMIRTLDQSVDGLKTKIKKNTKVLRSKTMLDYEVADGSKLVYFREQEIKCILKDNPILETVETIFLGEDGRIEVIDVTEHETTKTIVANEQNKCEIKTTMVKPLSIDSPPLTRKIKLRLFNSFMSAHEWWEVSQLYPCDEETFEIRFPKERDCKKVSIEKLDLDSLASEIQCETVRDETESHYLYTVKLPTNDFPARYKVHWEF